MFVFQNCSQGSIKNFLGGIGALDLTWACACLEMAGVQNLEEMRGKDAWKGQNSVDSLHLTIDTSAQAVSGLKSVSWRHPSGVQIS